jgi:hypothetical protein
LQRPPQYDNGGRFLGGTLSIYGDQLGFNYDDSISISTNNSGGASVNLNGEIGSFDPGQITDTDVFPYGGRNLLYVFSTNVPVNINSESNDAVTIGNGIDGVHGILATVTYRIPPTSRT